jgi:hypothetical protein
MRELKYLKTFESFQLELDETNEGFFKNLKNKLNPIINDIRDKLKLFFGIDDGKVAEDVYNQLNDLQKQGKIKDIIATGLTRANKDNPKPGLLPLNIDTKSNYGLFFNPAAKGSGANVTAG